MSEQLLATFDKIFEYCFDVFREKQLDYGPTWVLYRFTSLTDEIWRKAKRIRTLEEKNDESLIPEGRDSEYIGIINYCVMFLIRLDNENGLPCADELVCDLERVDEIDRNRLLDAYKAVTGQVKDLLYRKNTDYGDAWKSMSIGSMTDQIIIRIYRIKTIMKNGGVSAASEGVGSQLQDIINYCVFALIKMDGGVIDLVE